MKTSSGIQKDVKREFKHELFLSSAEVEIAAKNSNTNGNNKEKTLFCNAVKEPENIAWLSSGISKY